MKRIFSILALLALSMLVYTCTVTKGISKSQAGNPYPDRSFNPAPSYEYLTPEESLKTFNLPKGYHLELVASEPMIKEPVAIAWDGNAKMYVAEMLTYMQDADATNERLNISRIML
ncbi:MAG: cytochrome, partial [Segetibacter sp.]|nr:cytochrome [Segetibacter sp.]